VQVQVWYISPRGERWWCKRVPVSAVAFRQAEHINMSSQHLANSSHWPLTFLERDEFIKRLCDLLSWRDKFSHHLSTCRKKSHFHSFGGKIRTLTHLPVGVGAGLSQKASLDGDTRAESEWSGFMESWSGSNSIPQGTYAPPPPSLLSTRRPEFYCPHHFASWFAIF
jgi:hypothetical protein